MLLLPSLRSSVSSSGKAPVLSFYKVVKREENISLTGKDQFAAIDENGDGAVSFDEWSEYKS